jgi:hypothetical protein
MLFLYTEAGVEAAPAWAVAMEARIMSAQQDLIVMMHNGHCMSEHDRILQVNMVGNNNVPFPFPATRGDFLNLNVPDLDLLLLYYNLPVDGNIKIKQRRIGAKIGLRF